MQSETPLRILVADDDAMMPNTLRRLFRQKSRRPVDFTAVTNGVAALHALVHEGPFDVLMTDGNMPKMGGIELLERLLMEPEEHQPAIAIIWSDDDDLLANARARFRDLTVLSKTTGPSDPLEAMLDAVLGDART